MMKLTFVIFPEYFGESPDGGKGYLAACLENGMTGRGETCDEAYESLEKNITLQCIVDIFVGNKPLFRCRVAPKKYFDMFEVAMPLPKYAEYSEVETYTRSDTHFTATNEATHGPREVRMIPLLSMAREAE